MILRELIAFTEAKASGPLEFGFVHGPNAKLAEKALKDAGIAFKREDNFGVHYFFFDAAADHKKAVKLVSPLIDKSKEDEWN